MSEPTLAPTTTAALVAKSTVKAVTELSSRTSVVLQNVTAETAERASKLFGGPIEFAVPGYPPFAPSHLVVYTAGSETLALLSSKPQMISHRQAAEQIVATFSVNPRHFLYLSRMCKRPEGSQAGLCRDLVTEYSFEWEWINGAWRVTRQTFCYRVAPEIETAIGQMLALEEPSLTINVIDAHS